MTRIDFMTKTDEFMMNMDTYTAHYWLRMHMPNYKENYLRLQTNPSVNAMDKVDKASIDGLVGDGQKLYAENKEALEAFIRVIIDERYAPKAPAPPA